MAVPNLSTEPGARWLHTEHVTACPEPSSHHIKPQRKRRTGERSAQLPAINHDKRPVCLSLKRESKLEATSCRSRSPATLRRAAGSGGEVAIPSNTNYSQQKLHGAQELSQSSRGSSGLSAPLPHASARSGPGPLVSLEQKLLAGAAGAPWGLKAQSRSQTHWQKDCQPHGTDRGCRETSMQQHPAHHLTQGLSAAAAPVLTDSLGSQAAWDMEQQHLTTPTSTSHRSPVPRGESAGMVLPTLPNHSLLRGGLSGKESLDLTAKVE